ncbi:MAG: DUF4445 domain-containing protein [Opitutaceae bacterium]|nr:DUF4445 domain-containing protein [Opitutaceae bacterium]
MPQDITLHLSHNTCQAQPGASLFECAESMGVAVPTSCRKQGRCRECIVEVVEGEALLTGRTAAEKHLAPGYRLACCARVAATSAPGAEIRAHTMRRGAMRIERHAFHLPVRDGGWTPDPAVTRDGDRILLDGVEIDRGTGPLHGLAIDLGTTTVVLRLLNLETGEILADSSFENPQRFGGSDVMSRIHFDTLDGTRLLQRTLAGYLARAVQEMPVDPASIYEVVIVGNSTMRDLFFRLDVGPIGQSPYQSTTEFEVAAGRRASTSVAENARRLGLPVHPKARAYGLPVISGHVGADAAACMLAIGLAEEERTIALMDIGTNTELIVGNRHRVLAASCPAGPAFEGGQITFGMPGLTGAIERVVIAPDGSVQASVIGDEPPEGICGSGLVDLLSELVRTGRINPLGRFVEGETEFLVDARGERPITLSEADINALAQAKGANVAGLRIAVGEYGARFDDIAVFYLAGGFGRHLSIEASRRIGLIPDIDDARIAQIGNASIEGACIALLSHSRRAGLETLVRTVRHCRLETHPRFFDAFVDGCQFRPVDAVLEAAEPAS